MACCASRPALGAEDSHHQGHGHVGEAGPVQRNESQERAERRQSDVHHLKEDATHVDAVEDPVRTRVGMKRRAGYAKASWASDSYRNTAVG